MRTHVLFSMHKWRNIYPQRPWHPVPSSSPLLTLAFQHKMDGFALKLPSWGKRTDEILRKRAIFGLLPSSSFTHGSRCIYWVKRPHQYGNRTIFKKPKLSVYPNRTNIYSLLWLRHQLRQWKLVLLHQIVYDPSSYYKDDD